MKTEEIISTGTNRRSFLKGAGMAGLGLASAAAVITKFSSVETVKASGVNDIDILNFALNLEYLEAEYYSVALTGKTLVESGILTSDDESGPTTGGSMIPGLSSTSPASFLIQALHGNEIDHVKLLRQALGSQAVLKPAINLGALGYGFSNVLDFYKLSRQLEEVGTTAYLGAAPLISSKAYLATAASILSVEAKHVGALRIACLEANVDSPAVDSADHPPSVAYPFDNPFNGLTTPRTTTEVLKIVYGGGAHSGGFYPMGLNGTIK